ncbi:hypothetical protein GS597_15485 [Synechococcales cyanobacterium C]|uniref:Coiled coil domain-containing protein n=1 Tax=Petrachloros mirabilis ULC683 TaxID=2781853 RepID=A0A8K2A1R8_9CYAN|nr:hypothetical protein [Petrachloros mirabilis]NCJ07882.1 hypothetical protein [Petrachloros mirabilis ULC683]
MAIPSESKAAYQAKVKAQIDKLNAQIDEMKAKAEQAKANASIEYHSKLENLYAQRDTVQMKFNELQGASEEAWKELSKGFEAAWSDLQKSFDNAMTKFK